MNESARAPASDSQPGSDLLKGFILARMLPGKTPPTRSVLLKDLKPYFAVPHGLTDAAWGELLDAHLEGLVEAGILSRRPFALTAKGRQQALEFLGLQTLPAKCHWGTLKSRYLMARVLGIEPQKRGEWERISDGREGFKAALLARLFDLPLKRLPTLNQVIAALAASQGLRPARNDVNSLREAALRHWVEASGPPLVEPAQPLPTEPDVELFAREVLRIAQDSPPAKGGEKVFLRHVWERVRNEVGPRLTRQEFDARLLEASRRGLLALSRADMIGSVDPEDVRESEVRLPHGGTVHFVRIDRQR